MEVFICGRKNENLKFSDKIIDILKMATDGDVVKKIDNNFYYWCFDIEGWKLDSLSDSEKEEIFLCIYFDCGKI